MLAFAIWCTGILLFTAVAALLRIVQGDCLAVTAPTISWRSLRSAYLTGDVLQNGGLSDRLAEAANSTTDPLARQGAFEAYEALIKEIGTPVEPFVALVLSAILERCSDKVRYMPSTLKGSSPQLVTSKIYQRIYSQSC